MPYTYSDPIRVAGDATKGIYQRVGYDIVRDGAKRTLNIVLQASFPKDYNGWAAETLVYISGGIYINDNQQEYADTITLKHSGDYETICTYSKVYTDSNSETITIKGIVDYPHNTISWTSNGNTTNLPVTTSKIENVVIPAGTYTMTFKTSTGVASFTGSGTYNAGTSVSATATAKTGYLLSKYKGTDTSGNENEWEDCKGKTSHTDSWTVSRNRTITAYATAKTYTVTYNGNNSTSGSMSASTATYNANFTTTTNAYKKTGYTFVGWNESANGTGTWWNIPGYKSGKVDSASTGSPGVSETGTAWTWTYDKNITLYAQWIPNSYTVSYSFNSGSFENGTNKTYTDSNEKTYQRNPTTVSYDGTSGYDSSYFRVDKPVRTGYTFTGWKITGMDSATHYYFKTGESTGIEDSSTSLTVDGNVYYFKNLRATSGTVTFTAQWVANTYTVSYSLGGGEFTQGNDGTFTDSDGTTTYQRNPTTVTYDGTDGYVSSYFRVDKPVKSGYVFGGWKITGMDSVTHYYFKTGTSSSDATTVTSSSTTTEGDVYYFRNLRATSGTVTFTVIWNAIVEYNANGGTGIPNNQTKDYEKTLILSNIKPTRTGYVFKGWATYSTGAVAYKPNGEYKIDSHIVLYAVWERQPNIKLRQNGKWRSAILWVRVNGIWRTGFIHMKKDGDWKKNK